MNVLTYPCCAHYCSEFDKPVDHSIPCDIPGCPGGIPNGEKQ